MKSKEILTEAHRRDLQIVDFGPVAEIVDLLISALSAAEKELQEDKESFLKTIQTREGEIHTHISRVQELEKEIKEYKKLAKDNVPELVKMLKNRK